MEDPTGSGLDSRKVGAVQIDDAGDLRKLGWPRVYTSHVTGVPPGPRGLADALKNHWIAPVRVMLNNARNRRRQVAFQLADGNRRLEFALCDQLGASPGSKPRHACTRAADAGAERSVQPQRVGGIGGDRRAASRGLAAFARGILGELGPGPVEEPRPLRLSRRAQALRRSPPSAVRGPGGSHSIHSTRGRAGLSWRGRSHTGWWPLA